MPHLSISNHAVIAHNGEIHRTPTRTTTAAPSTQTTAVEAATPNTREIALPPGPQFLGESLLMLIIVTPLILWRIRRQGLTR
ncbi:hypothetical protein IQ266_11355 [filamentous cyanobacterium LEGE 11480]|uniref:Uncharacterized protein n=1 Tax=Romeriopsis navalis LEGE 11480 TaxID=2777977 RepID=A0A928VKL8_9CYAN|nr:hypothetical protein [Romeriopsis navalis]MBE9030328.1 hypothetical protein [Romeriopsis navalis LEGE 11480]